MHYIPETILTIFIICFVIPFWTTIFLGFVPGNKKKTELSSESIQKIEEEVDIKEVDIPVFQKPKRKKKSAYSIRYEPKQDRITITLNGKPHAWGSYYYKEDMEKNFERYQFAEGKPVCKYCGDSFLEHLEPSGLKLDTRPGRHCHASGGCMDPGCNCPGYAPKTPTQHIPVIYKH